MKSLLTVLALVLATAAVPRAHAQMLPDAQKPQMIDRVVAVAQGDVILQSELDQAVQQIRHQYASHANQLPPEKVLEQQVLQRLILMKLQVQRAEDHGVRVSDSELNQAVSNIAQQNHMTPAQLRQAVQQEGINYDSFRRQIADQIIVQRLRQGVVRNSVKVTDSEINNLLNSPAFQGGKVHLAHIDINLPEGADAQQIQNALDRAQKVEKAIKNGMDFNAAAIRYSEAQDALDGGDLGWRRLDAVPPAFVTVVNKMQPGQVTPPLRGPTGFHILKLIARHKPIKQVVTEYHARQIMIKPSTLVSAQDAKKKIDTIYKDIVKKHQDFAKLAKAKSDDDTTANLGGDMGWFQLNDWGTAIAQQMQNLKDDEVSKPFQTQGGAWHILKRLGSRRADRTNQEQRKQAQQAIANRKAEQFYENYLRDMRSSSYVRILVPSLRPPKGSGAS